MGEWTPLNSNHHAGNKGASEPSDPRDNNQQLGELARGHTSPPRPDEAQGVAGGPEEAGEYDQGDGLAAEAEERGREVEVNGKVPPLVELQDSRVHNRWNLIPNLLQRHLPDCKYSEFYKQMQIHHHI